MKELSYSATIEDVAIEANVSVATVSRVINQSSLVRLPTKLRVEKAIETLGYVPNTSARNLRKRESRVVLILVPNLTNPFYSHILSGICDCAQELGYSGYICSSQAGSTEDMLNEILETKRADGAILLAVNYDDSWLEKYADRFPMVQCAEAVDDLKLPYVAIDNYAAMKDSVSYAQSLGHERLALITIGNKYISTRLRRQGYHDAVIEIFGKDAFDPSLIFETADYEFESGRMAAVELLKRESRPTAILCGSDVLALGAVAGARELGLSTPEDVSVIGFDDVDYTKMFHPYLTTIRQPCYELGRQSMRVLQQCITNGDNGCEGIVLPHELKIRESTAKARTNQ